MVDEIERHAREADPAVARRLFHHAVVGIHPALVDDLGDLGDLAAREVRQPRANAARHAERDHVVAEAQLPCVIAELVQAVDLVTGKACNLVVCFDVHEDVPSLIVILSVAKDDNIVADFCE